MSNHNSRDGSQYTLVAVAESVIYWACALPIIGFLGAGALWPYYTNPTVLTALGSGLFSLVVVGCAGFLLRWWLLYTILGGELA